MIFAVIAAVVIGWVLLNQSSSTAPPLLGLPTQAGGGIQSNVANVNSNMEMAVGTDAINGVSAIASGDPIGAITGLATSLWQGHVQRLQDAQSENQAADQGVPAWDSDFQGIIAMWNSGRVSAQTAAAYMQQLKNQIYAYMKNIGASSKPGTAWTEYSSPTAAPPQPCNKACTVACCIYTVYLQGPMNIFMALVQGQQIQAGWGVAGFKSIIYKNGYATWMLGTIQPSKYSAFTRPGYQVSVRMPS